MIMTVDNTLSLKQYYKISLLDLNLPAIDLGQAMKCLLSQYANLFTPKPTLKSCYQNIFKTDVRV